MQVRSSDRAFLAKFMPIVSCRNLLHWCFFTFHFYEASLSIHCQSLIKSAAQRSWTELQLHKVFAHVQCSRHVFYDHVQVVNADGSPNTVPNPNKASLEGLANLPVALTNPTALAVCLLAY
jgi:hypothetical protein